MNFGEPEDFFKRHRYFFTSFSFKFEGFSREKENELVETVTKLSGDASKDGDYVICDKAYYKQQKNSRSNTDYYSVKFIEDCISKIQILKIDEYKFDDDKENVSNQIHKNNFCNKVEKRKENSCKETERIDNKKSSLKRTEIIYLSSDEEEKTEEEALNNHSSKKLKILDPCSINSKFGLKWKKGEKQGQSSKTAGTSDKIKKKITVEEVIDTSEDAIQHVDEASTAASPPLSSSASKDNDHVNSGGEASDNNDVVVLRSQNHWWKHLPDVSSQGNLAKIVVSNSIVSNKGRTGRPRKSFLASEQKIMIAFLIKYNLIENYSSSSRVPWETMHNKGYLLHRSVESLSNHYRRTILPTITHFKLPRKYEKRFLLAR